MPGPGNYSFDKGSIGRGGPSYTIKGKESRGDKSLSPGPGAYQADYAIVKDSLRSYKMGNTKRTDIVSKELVSSPGPGNYDADK